MFLRIVEALPRILSSLDAMGYRCVPLPSS
jgi:hypothetical protein